MENDLREKDNEILDMEMNDEYIDKLITQGIKDSQ